MAQAIYKIDPTAPDGRRRVDIGAPGAPGAPGNDGAPGAPGSGIDAQFIRGVNVAATVPTNGQALVFDGTNYAPGNVAGGGSTEVPAVAGEAVSARDVVYIELAGGVGTVARAYRADNKEKARSTEALLAGVVANAGAVNAPISARRAGVVSGFAGLTPGATYYVSAAGAITLTAPGNARRVGIALSATDLLLDIAPAPVLTPYKGLYEAPASALKTWLKRAELGTGTTWPDASGSGNNATTNATVRAADGMQFSGSAYAELPGAASVKGQAASSSCIWFKMNAAPSGQAAIYYESTSVSGNSRFLVNLTAAAKVQFIARDSDAAASFTIETPGALVVGQWTHIAAVYNSPASSMKIYVNGAEVVADSAAKGPHSNSVPANPIRLGNAGVFGSTVQGVFGDTLLYTRALSASEINDIRLGTQP